MNTFKLILSPAMYKASKKTAEAEGVTIGEYCQRFSPVPLEVYVQPKLPRFDPGGNIFKEPLDNISRPDHIGDR